MPERAADASTLADFLRVVRRRKWIIVQAVVLVPVVAVLHAVHKPDLYASSAQVLLSRQNIAATFAGAPDVYASQDATRYAATQAFLARSPVVAERVVRDVRVPGQTAASFLGASAVSAAKDADLLTFTVMNGEPALARRLADAYAREFTIFRRELDTSAIRSALKQVGARVADLRRAGETNTAMFQTLSERQQQLETLEALERQNAYVARPAGTAHKIQPRPKRDGLLGLGLGLALGIGLAFLREALDTRIRSAEEVAERLGLPLLGRLPEPSRRLRAAFGLVMLDEPYSVQAETFRMLRTNLELTNLDRRARLIMITSAVEMEGKTTTAANLGVALARAGRDVIVVDLDLRRPALHRFFGLDGRQGLADVALGDVALDDALVPIPLAELPGVGSLHVLPCGPVPPDPGEFAGNDVLGHVLLTLRDRADVVLIDTPPVLHAAEAMSLSTRVDAMVIIARLNLARRGTLTELKRMLESAPAAKLGFVLTAADLEPDYDQTGYLPRAYAHAGEDLVA